MDASTADSGVSTDFPAVRARKRAREYSEAETEVERMEVECEPIAQVKSKTEEQGTKERCLVCKTDARIDLEGTNVKV